MSSSLPRKTIENLLSDSLSLVWELSESNSGKKILTFANMPTKMEKGKAIAVFQNAKLKLNKKVIHIILSII